MSSASVYSELSPMKKNWATAAYYMFSPTYKLGPIYSMSWYYLGFQSRSWFYWVFEAAIVEIYGCTLKIKNFTMTSESDL